MFFLNCFFFPPRCFSSLCLTFTSYSTNPWILTFIVWPFLLSVACLLTLTVPPKGFSGKINMKLNFEGLTEKRCFSLHYMNLCCTLKGCNGLVPSSLLSFSAPKSIGRNHLTPATSVTLFLHVKAVLAWNKLDVSCHEIIWYLSCTRGKERWERLLLIIGLHGDSMISCLGQNTWGLFI